MDFVDIKHGYRIHRPAVAQVGSADHLGRAVNRVILHPVSQYIDHFVGIQRTGSLQGSPETVITGGTGDIRMLPFTVFGNPDIFVVFGVLSRGRDQTRRHRLRFQILPVPGQIELFSEWRWRVEWW